MHLESRQSVLVRLLQSFFIYSVVKDPLHFVWSQSGMFITPLMVQLLLHYLSFSDLGPCSLPSPAAWTVNEVYSYLVSKDPSLRDVADIFKDHVSLQF